MRHILQPLRHTKLRYLLFLALLLSGIIPLVVSNTFLIGQNRERLKTEERTQLTQAAESLSREVTGRLEDVRIALYQLGGGFLAAPGPDNVEARLHQDWAARFFHELSAGDSDLAALRVLDRDGSGVRFGPEDLPEVQKARDDAFAAALEKGHTVFRFVVHPSTHEPLVSVAVPVLGKSEAPELVAQALVRLPLTETVFRHETKGEVGTLVVDGSGKILWSDGVGEEGQAALVRSGVAEGFSQGPALPLTREYVAKTSAGKQTMLAQVIPVGDTGWAVVVQKPAAAAFAAINRMVVGAIAATALLVLLALFFAAFAARRVSLPIQRLAATSHEIAEGNFGRRMEAHGLPAELADLARDFNRMSGHVESYVSRLREAARVNRELFIGSIRAFAAAIDAKDPYTRGHSERVASVSRVIARNLSLPEETQQKIWIAALLHDVGKIGVEDQVLRKVGRLTDEEYEQMKAHTVIGAEIMSSIEQLREAVPVIRWHHEAWNGRGYPDGKKGEEIPLWARIVSVADTFDAVTTNRPYQQAYDIEEAIAIITKLTGQRFDAKVVTAFLRAYETGEVATPDPGPAPRAEAGKISRIGVGALS